MKYPKALGVAVGIAVLAAAPALIGKYKQARSPSDILRDGLTGGEGNFGDASELTSQIKNKLNDIQKAKENKIAQESKEQGSCISSEGVRMLTIGTKLLNGRTASVKSETARKILEGQEIPIFFSLNDDADPDHAFSRQVRVLLRPAKGWPYKEKKGGMYLEVNGGKEVKVEPKSQLILCDTPTHFRVTGIEDGYRDVSLELLLTVSGGQ